MKKSVAFFFSDLSNCIPSWKKKKKKKKKKKVRNFLKKKKIEKLPGFFKILWKEKFQVYVF